METTVRIPERLAEEVALRVLEKYRESQKRGRNDQGTGSKKFGMILRKERERAGHNFQSLGHAAGIHPTTISKIESGQRGMSLRTFGKLADILGIDFVNEVVQFSVRN